VLNPEKTTRIPSKFTLFGHTYKVVLEKDLFEKENCYGTADDDLKLIKLQALGGVVKKREEDGKIIEVPLTITDKTLIETFFHEVVHAILDAAGETELSENERFVNIMGKAWLEIYLSSEYEKEESH
jgi:hypothetical protein